MMKIVRDIRCLLNLRRFAHSRGLPSVRALSQAGLVMGPSSQRNCKQA